MTKNDRHSRKTDSPKMIALSTVTVIAFSKAKIALSTAKMIAILKSNQQQDCDR
jgi:hypothetical protein